MQVGYKNLNGLQATAGEIDEAVTRNLRTAENGGYSWWVYPNALRISEGVYDDKIIYSIVNKNKETIAIHKNLITQEENRFVLFTNLGIADEHNNAAFCLANGYVITAYTQHDQDNYIRVRKSNSKGNIDFGSETALLCSGIVTYAQLFYTSTGFVSLLYRVNTTTWAYRKSTDYGVTFGDEVIIVNGTGQYYLRGVNSSTNQIKLVLVGHPTASTDHVLRYGLITPSDGKIFTSSNVLLGNTIGTNLPIAYSSFTALYTPTGLLRLFDIAETTSSLAYAFATFTDETDGELWVKKSTNLVKICDIGAPIENPVGSLYFAGAWFKSGVDTTLYVAREEAGEYIIEEYSTVNHTSWTLVKELIRSSNKINRPVHPRGGGDLLMYNNPATYVSFTDFYSRVEFVGV